MSTDFETLEYEALESLAADLEQCLAEAEAQNKALREALAKAEEFGALDKLTMAERLLVRWCSAEGGAFQERVFEDTMAFLDPADTGFPLSTIQAKREEARAALAAESGTPQESKRFWCGEHQTVDDCGWGMTPSGGAPATERCPDCNLERECNLYEIADHIKAAIVETHGEGRRE